MTLSPLAGVLDQLGGKASPSHRERITAALGALLGELAVAVEAGTGSSLLWRPLNHQLLLRTRHSAGAVRCAALKCCLALAQRLGDEYNSLVPETLPYVVEALEDGDEEAERAARALVAQIEGLLGQSLAEYLDQ